MPRAPRIYIETYGCQMNVSDSELMLGVLGREGYVRTADPAEADVLLVNTCAVRDHAEQRVLGRMGELKRYKRPGDVLGVVGCMAQRLGPKLLERVPQVDLVIGPDGYRGLPELIARAREGERAAETTFRSWEHYEDVPPVRERQVSAFVTVQRGCDYRCTFCIVPMTRGPERSRKLADVVREVSGLAESGTSEVTLLGQTVNSYHDGDHDFADLLRAVGAVAGIRRLRFTSPYATDFTPRVLAAMAATPAVCEHVHSAGRHTASWSRGRPSVAGCCRPARARTRSRCWKVRRTGSARTSTFASQARPDRPSRPCEKHSSSRGSNQCDVRGRAARIPQSARRFPQVLWLRHVPRRCARIRAQSPGPALRCHAPGRDSHRVVTSERPGKSEARRGAARRIPQSRPRASLRSKTQPAVV